MTLDEAIAYCEDSGGWEHKRLAVWLKELKTQRGFADYMIDRCTRLEKRLQELGDEKAESA